MAVELSQPRTDGVEGLSMTSATSARALGAALAIFISYTSILSIGYGLLGLKGSSIITGSVLAGSLVSVFLLSIRTFSHLLPIDLLFCGLVAVVTLSTVINDAPEISELLLLAASMFAYVACRSISMESLYAFLPSFKRTTGIVVAVGVAFTLATLLYGRINLGRPVVLGFSALPLHLLTSLGFLTLALVTTDHPRARRTAAISAATFVASAILAAAMVRYAFAALVLAMGAAALLAPKNNRWHVGVVTLALIVGTIVGMSTRSDMAKVYLGWIGEAVTGRAVLQFAAYPPVTPDAPCANVNIHNSVQVRKYLAKEALAKIPDAGPIGAGLESFSRSSCLKQYQVHNSVLQTLVEFGWLGGSIFVALIGCAIIGLLPTAPHYGPARFLLAGLIFAVLMSLAHGQISRDGILFAFLGCAVGVSRTAKKLEFAEGKPASIRAVVSHWLRLSARRR